MKKNFLFRLMNFWPPFLGAGIRVKCMDATFRHIEVEMKLRFWNQNIVGVHFGGSLYSMTDPFFMLMVMENLGPDYLVWDQTATIRFKKPGRGRVRARFSLEEADLNAIKNQLEDQSKATPLFRVDITDDFGNLIAEVEKQLWIRKKTPSTLAPPSQATLRNTTHKTL